MSFLVPRVRSLSFSASVVLNLFASMFRVMATLARSLLRWNCSSWGEGERGPGREGGKEGGESIVKPLIKATPDMRIKATLLSPKNTTRKIRPPLYKGYSSESQDFAQTV